MKLSKINIFSWKVKENFRVLENVLFGCCMEKLQNIKVLLLNFKNESLMIDSKLINGVYTK